MSKKIALKNEITDFLFYSTSNGKVKIEIFFHNEEEYNKKQVIYSDFDMFVKKLITTK